MRLFFESLPISAAMFALIFTCRRALLTKNKHVVCLALLGALNAILLIIAQTSWAWSVNNGHSVGETLANYIWTIFNFTTMVTISYAAIKVPK